MINQNLFLKDLLLTLDLNLKDESKLEVKWYGEHYSVRFIMLVKFKVFLLLLLMNVPYKSDKVIKW